MMPLNAATLNTSAGMLEVLSRQEKAREHHLREAFEKLRDTGFSGTAYTAMVAFAHSLVNPLSTPPQQMLALAHLLRSVAALQADLDTALAYATALANRIADATPAFIRLHHDLSRLGDVLDIVCAHHIIALCTPVEANPARRLGDFHGISAEAIHFLMLPAAPSHVRELLANNPDTTLLEVSPGQVVIAVGDIDTAPAVTTFVPGVGSSAPEALSGQLARTRQLAAASGGAGILWLGYTAPATIAHGVAKEPARQAGAALATFQEDLARRSPTQQRTTVGYSYGAVVAGYAATGERGLHSDDLVLLGAPGVPASHANALVLHPREPSIFSAQGTSPQGLLSPQGSSVHVITHGGDPVGLGASGFGGVHGKDPSAASFGARVIAGDPLGNHSSYFDSEELTGLLRELHAGSS